MKFLKASLPHLNLLTKIILVVAILAMSAFGALMVRLQKGPLDLSFAKPTIERALSSSASGYEVRINSAQLIWPEIMGAMLIDLKGTNITQNGVNTLSVDQLAIGLSGVSLMQGKIRPSVIVVDGPTFQISHKESAFFTSEEKNEAEGAPLPSALPQKAQDIRQSIRTLLNQSLENKDIDALSALKKISLKNVVLSAYDFKADIVAPIAVADLNLEKNSLGLEGKLNISLPSGEGKNAYLKSDILYRRAEKDVTFTSELKDFNPLKFENYMPLAQRFMAQDVLVAGKILAAFDENLKLQSAKLDLNLPTGELTLPELYDTPLSVREAVLNANLNRSKNQLNISQLDAVIGGVPIKMQALGTLEKGNISAPVTLKIDDVALSDVAAIFPKSHLESDAGEWLTQRMEKGRLKDIELTTDFSVLRNPATQKRDAKMTNVKAKFKAEGVTVKYSSTLMPVTDVIAEGEYADDSLIVRGQSGKIGDIEGRDVNLKLEGLSVVGGGMAHLTLKANGPFKTALQYASAEPISLGENLGFDINQVKGNIAFDLDLQFPTVKDLPKEEVIVKINGKLTDLFLPKIVKDLNLTGGPYDLKFADGVISLDGSGQLDKRPITLSWMEHMDAKGKDFESKITAKINGDAALRQAFGIGLGEYISGSIPLDITYIDRGAKTTIDVKGDLTPASVHIKPFDYVKQPNVAGALSLRAIMKGDTLEEVDQLKVTAKGLSLTDGRLIFKEFKDRGTDVARGNIGQVLLGKTDIAVDFEIKDNNILNIVANGAVMDIAPFLKSDTKTTQWDKPEVAQEKTTQAMKISLNAKKLLADQGEALGASKIYLETDTQGDVTRIEMDAKIGAGEMYLRFMPEELSGKRTFRLESTDAGYTLKAFGVSDKIRGGSLLIYGQPQNKDLKGNLFGTAKIENFSVKNAPALTKLLGMMSLSGIQNLLNNEGISFTKLESSFEWRFREDGNLLVMKDGRTSGASIGLTFEGLMNQKQNTLDVSGTVIPVSGVNKAIGQIPVLGNILTGGDALIAATYSMKGAANDPNVTLNPLSVLAPGFLRKIFFEEDVATKVKKEEAKSPSGPSSASSPSAANDNAPPAQVPNGVQQPEVIAPNINAN